MNHNLSQPPQPKIKVFADGGARGNPGPAAIGVVIKDRNDQIIHQFGKTIGKATNNQAEYQAVIAALTWLITNQTPCQSVHFFLDSTLVVNQLNGLWKIKNPHLRQLIIHLRQLEAQLNRPIQYTSIPRLKNSQADALLNLALDKDHSLK